MTCACDGLEYGMTEENHKKEKEILYGTETELDRLAQSRLCQEKDRVSEEPNTIRITARLQDVEYRSFFDFADTYWGIGVWNGVLFNKEPTEPQWADPDRLCGVKHIGLRHGAWLSRFHSRQTGPAAATICPPCGQGIRLFVLCMLCFHHGFCFFMTFLPSSSCILRT